MKAAFTKEGDLFTEKGVRFLDTFVNLSKPDLLERQMFEEFKDILGLSPEENKRAIEQGYRALDHFDNVTMRGAAREVLDQLEREDRLGVVLLGRPYHNDPGVNHEILEEFQKLGYPVFAQDCLPIDDDILWRLFGEDVLSGRIVRIRWRSTTSGRTRYSENTSRKVWAAKYVARHPNLVALELSSFKCGHDAPIYTVVEEIVEHSGHAVLLLQGHRREQADRLDQDPRRDHRLLPEALPRRHGPQQAEGQHDRGAARGVRSAAAAADAPREAGHPNELVRDSFETGSMPQIHVTHRGAGGVAAAAHAASRATNRSVGFRTAA